ncbi:hypothetical protein [Aneurinibacillus tyrosinisolvens]|jgi:hypothetical protein|uniref:hypothetical protein n=1 Tax=Aneurinibacillus tyrosinisolvens TaxID=1443435 RepID=UPI00063F15E0|nr:hypothetical protein [Aneurinibacillus tyrosinisolvens]
MYIPEEKRLILKLAHKKRTDLSIPIPLRRQLYSIVNAQFVFSTEEKEVIIGLLQEESKKLFLRLGTRKTVRSLLQKLQQTTKNERINGIAHVKPVRFK